jgi:Ca-activated chloride channel family protein
VRGSGHGSRAGPVRLVLGLAAVMVVLAAARPTVELDPAQQPSILTLVVDTSGSTMADDLAPSRLQAIQQATDALLDKAPPDLRVGLIRFSEEVETLTRPTTDHHAVRRHLASLFANGGTAIGDALQRALDDIQATDPAASARILLLSDGANSAGRDPLEVAPIAAARRIPIMAVAVGTPDGKLIQPTLTGTPRIQPVPPDPTQLAALTGPTGGRVLQAQSSPQLDAALTSLLWDARILDEHHELTLLFAAAALLLLAIAAAITAAGRPAAAGFRRWTPAAGLLIAAATAATLWTQWQPTAPLPAAQLATTAGGNQAAPPRAASPGGQPSRRTLLPSSVTVDPALRQADRRIVEQATTLLYRLGELAEQRPAEIGRPLSKSFRLDLSACESCKPGALSAPASYFTPLGADCEATLNLPLLKQQAKRARLPVTELTALAILHEQEQCLRQDDITLAPFTAEQRLARKLRHARLFDLLFVQVDARTPDWQTVQQAAAILREHHELAVQRHRQLRQRRLNQTGPLYVEICNNCFKDRLAEYVATPQGEDTVECGITIDLARTRAQARVWSVTAVQLTAVMLTHEQEHCIQFPNGSEGPAVEAERQLARKLGDFHLIRYTTR